MFLLIMPTDRQNIKQIHDSRINVLARVKVAIRSAPTEI